MATGSFGKPAMQVVSGIPRSRPQEYNLEHDATTDWQSIEAGDRYSVTVLASVHGFGASPIIKCMLDSGAGFVAVLPDEISVATNGDVVVRVSQAGADGRYAGRIQIARF